MSRGSAEMAMKKMFNYQGLGLLVAVCWTLLFPGRPVSAAISPLEQIRLTVEGILGVMQNKEMLSPENKKLRREKIMAHVNRRFDFEEMSKLTLASNWKERTPDEKRDFQRLFSELLKNTYIGRVEAYSDEEVIYEKEIFDGAGRSRAMVYTNIIKNNQEIPINYKLMDKNGEWFVYDVMIEGVSLVRNYRTEFARILSKEKYQGLITRIKEKIDSQEASRD